MPLDYKKTDLLGSENRRLAKRRHGPSFLGEVRNVDLHLVVLGGDEGLEGAEVALEGVEGGRHGNCFKEDGTERELRRAELL